MEKQAISISVVSIIFLAGVVAGCLAAMSGGQAADMAVTEYLTGFVSGAYFYPSYLQSFLQAFAYPVLCFLFGLTLFGVFCIPAVVAVRGFLLAFAVTSCVRVFGSGGLLLSAALMGIPALLTVPCMFALASHGGLTGLSLFLSAVSRGKRRPPTVFTAPAFRRLGICVIAMTAATIADIFLCPALLKACLPLVA